MFESIWMHILATVYSRYFAVFFLTQKIMTFHPENACIYPEVQTTYGRLRSCWGRWFIFVSGQRRLWKCCNVLFPYLGLVFAWVFLLNFWMRLFRPVFLLYFFCLSTNELKHCDCKFNKLYMWDGAARKTFASFVLFFPSRVRCAYHTYMYACNRIHDMYVLLTFFLLKVTWDHVCGYGAGGLFVKWGLGVWDEPLTYSCIVTYTCTTENHFTFYFFTFFIWFNKEKHYSIFSEL